MGLFRTAGHGGDSGSITDIEAADLVLIVGSNTAESHPVVATRVKSSHKLNGQKLIVSDLRENEVARRNIEPECLEGAVKTIPEAIAQATADGGKPVGLFGLIRKFTSKDSLPGLAAAADFLQAFGRHLPSPGSSNS
jgi:predicted molibdopterin-dependent oxidoreductase YjgC